MTEPATLPLNVIENLNRYFPKGGKPSNLYVTDESLKRKCSRCGRCCALSTMSSRYSMDEIKELARQEDESDITIDARFVAENWVPISQEEAASRGLNAGPFHSCYYSCKRLTPEGLCSVYKDRPPVCFMHPVLDQSVWKQCVYADSEIPNTRIVGETCLKDEYDEDGRVREPLFSLGRDEFWEHLEHERSEPSGPPEPCEFCGWTPESDELPCPHCDPDEPPCPYCHVRGGCDH